MSNSLKESEFLNKAEKGVLPHCILLTGPREKTSPFAVDLALALSCPIHGGQDCSCSVCRRIRQGIFPDVETIDREDAVITVDSVRAMRADAYVAPLESRGKVFIIKNAHNMNGAAQNAALKLFEEPPSGVSFILTADRADMLLPTVLSRCVSIHLDQDPEPDDLSGTVHEQSDAFVKAFAQEDELALFLVCLDLEKLKKNAAAEFLDSLLAALRSSIRVCAAVHTKDHYPQLTALGTEKLMRMTRIILERREGIDKNTGIAHLMGTIAPQYFGA